MKRCPKCNRFGLEAIGNGFIKCLWDNCLYLISLDLIPDNPVKEGDKFTIIKGDFE
jgi:hypothetical protein